MQDMATACPCIARRHGIDLPEIRRVIAVVIGKGFAIAFEIEVRQHPPAPIGRGIGLVAEFVQITPGMAERVVDDRIGLPKRIVALAARAVSDVEIIGIASTVLDRYGWSRRWNRKANRSNLPFLNRCL